MTPEQGRNKCEEIAQRHGIKLTPVDAPVYGAKSTLTYATDPQGEAYKKIMETKDMIRLAQITTNISLGFLGGEVLAPAFALIPKGLQLGMGGIGMLATGWSAGEVLGGTSLKLTLSGPLVQDISGWDRFEQGAYSSVGLLSLGLASGIQRAQRLSATQSFSAKAPVARSLGAAARETNKLELEVIHRAKESKGLPPAGEMIAELKRHRSAIQYILDTESLDGLQSRIKEYSNFKADLEILRAQINKSLGSAGTGRVWSHTPDMVLGADPFAIHGSADARVNSIMGAASRSWAQQIGQMNPTNSRSWSLSLKLTLVH